MASDWLALAGKVCVVTGASRGLGATVATALAAQGCRLLLLDIDQQALEAIAADLRSTGVDVRSMLCDVTNPDSIDAAAQVGQASFGAVDVLVNNAGILRPGAMADLSLSDWNLLLQVNLTGYFLCAQRFGQAMRQNGTGSIINISSISGSIPQPFSGAYSVSKAGLQMLSRVLAIEWGEFGVRSNVVAPAMMITPLTEGLYRDPAVAERRRSAIPLRRIGVPNDLASAVLFLASERSSYITGEEVLVDGGWSQNLLALVPRPGFERPA
jgi:NAD(P)-dependent dehydrogenase (short-subunit alcohol dehydrogenase family)